MRKEIPYLDHAESLKDCMLVVGSVFEFIGPDELFCFLGACQRNNITVRFSDEDIEVPPYYDMSTQLRLIMMSWLSTNPVEIEQYLRYRDKIHRESMSQQGLA